MSCRDLNSTHYYRDVQLESDPIVEAIEELKEDVEELQTDVADLEATSVELSDKIDIIKSGDYTFVKWHGAVGDGITDDTAAIQAAIDSGKTYIIFDKGIYKVSSQGQGYACLKVPSNTILLGEGATIHNETVGSATIINKTPWFDNQTLGGGYTANENITIDGINFTGLSTINLDILAFAHCNNITVRNCRFNNLGGWHFIEFNGCEETVVDNCYFYNYVGTSSTEMVKLDIITSDAVFPFFGPYDATVCKDVYISNCTFENPYIYFTNNYLKYHHTPAAIGNHQHLIGFYVNGVKIVNNQFVHMHSACKFDSLHSATIEGNDGDRVKHFFYQHDQYTPNDAFEDINISNNVILSTLGESADYDFVTNPNQLNAIYGYFKNSIFSNNLIFGFPNNAFVIKGRSNVISGNKMNAIGGSGILCYGAEHYVITGNGAEECNQFSRLGKADFELRDGDVTGGGNNISGNTFGNVVMASTGGKTLFNGNNILLTATKGQGDNSNIYNNLVNNVWKASGF